MKRISLIGGGLIGRAWAIVFARAGYSVAIYEPDAQALSQVSTRISRTLEEMERHSLITTGEQGAILDRVVASEDLSTCLQNAEYVQECVPEVLEVKQDTVYNLEKMVEDNVVLASSTSTFMPSVLFKRCRVKTRCVVVHPVNPPYLVPLVEVVPSSETSTATVDQVRALMRAVGQIPIMLKREIEGFVLNRLQVALVNEAISLVSHGVASMDDVDAAMKYGLGRRWVFMGPFETIDLNAPEGIKDYLSRFEELYTLARKFEPMAPFSNELIHALEVERRQTLPSEELESRAAWRDQELMRVSRFMARHGQDQE